MTFDLLIGNGTVIDGTGSPGQRLDVGIRDQRVAAVGDLNGATAHQTIDADGRCKTPVGDTVDVVNATWTNTIGANGLLEVWEDPDFDPALPAFYYARVIEIPTPRWTAYEAKRFSVKFPDGVPMTTQERAYTSPIWYTPGS